MLPPGLHSATIECSSVPHGLTIEFPNNLQFPLGACVVRTCLLRLHAKMVEEPSTCEGSPLGATFLAVFFAQVIVSRCRPFNDLDSPASYDHDNK